MKISLIFCIALGGFRISFITDNIQFVFSEFKTPFLNLNLGYETCLGSVKSTDVFQSSLFPPKSSKTDSEIII